LATSELDRRSFIKTAAVAGSGLLAAPAQAVAQSTPAQKNMVGIQVGAVSFLDEGTGKVLDIFQERAHVNTLFMATFTYGRGIAGRQVPDQPLPDHGKQAYDTDTFHGGNYAAVHPRYYKDTPIKAEDTRAPDHGNFDVLAEVIPEAKRRGMRTICWCEDVWSDKLPNVDKIREINMQGSRARTQCYNNPGHRNFLLGLFEDYARSYDIDGIMWCSERQGPLGQMLTSTGDANRVTCFCEFCQQKATQRGINIGRVREGYTALASFVRDGRAKKHPVDGAYVMFWRIILRYPEILSWEHMWNDSLRDMYSAIYTKVKSVKPNLEVGWHIWHINSWSWLYRAEQDLQQLSAYSDYLKMVMYNNCAGPRIANYIDHIETTLFADFSKQESLDVMYRVMNYQEHSLDQIPYTGLSADYVYRETKRAVDGAAGTKTRIWPGIDIDIPTTDNQTKCTPHGVQAAVHEAIRGGAHGVLLSRKYSEMKLANLSGAGQAIIEAKFA
jgi:hypothetical protein